MFLNYVLGVPLSVFTIAVSNLFITSLYSLRADLRSDNSSQGVILLHHPAVVATYEAFSELFQFFWVWWVNESLKSPYIPYMKY